MFVLSRSANTLIVWKSSANTCTPVRARADLRLDARVRLLEVVARGRRHGVGEPVERDLGEDLLLGDQARPVAEGVEQLVVGELADRGVGEPDGDRLRARAVHLVVAADRLEPLHVLEPGVVRRLEALELGRVARREAEQVQDVQAEEPGRVEQAELAGDHRAAVAAVGAVGLVAEPAHQGVVGARDPGHRPAAVGHRRREPEARHRRHDHRERVLARARRGRRGR